MSIEDDIAFIERVPTLRMLGRTALRILAIGADQADLGDADAVVDAGAGVALGRRIVRSAGYGSVPWIADWIAGK